MMLESAAAMGSVKMERPDDAEIQEMADKIRENNKVKMSTPAASNATIGRTLILGSGGQTTLTKYMAPRTNGTIALASAASTAATAVPGTDDDKPMDKESQRGRFGWCTIATQPLPYIFRYDENKTTKRKELVKYCSVRMAETKVLCKYFTHLHSDIHNLGNVKSYFLTDAEARLFNDINLRHCDCHFGPDQFTNRDTVVRVDDAVDFRQFLEYSYNRIAGPAPSAGDQVRCGFIRINNESVVPFTVKNDVKYVPLFYFEGETESLREKAIIMNGWNLTYLKFCCKVQGIRSELYVKDDIAVISLDAIKSYFPAGTKFDDYWPAKVQDNQLFSKNGVPTTNVSWTQPTGGPVPTKNQIRAYSTAAAAGAAPMWASQQSSVRMVANATRWPPTVAYQQYMQQQQPQQQARPPPLVRTALSEGQAHARMPVTTISMAQTQSRGGYAITQPKQMGRMVTATGSGGVAQYRFSGYNPDAMDLTGQQRAYTRATKEIRPALAPNLSNQYYFENHYVDGHLLPCIVPKVNYRREDPLIMISDFTYTLFPNLQPSSIKNVLTDVLKVTLHKPNKLQLDLIRQSGRFSREDIPLLIKHTDANTYLPQIKYVVNNKTPESLQQSSDAVAKRMRIS